MLARMLEALVSDSEEDKYVDYQKRRRRSLGYKIKIDLLNFYDKMHFKEFFDWIT